MTSQSDYRIAEARRFFLAKQFRESFAIMKEVAEEKQFYCLLTNKEAELLVDVYKQFVETSKDNSITDLVDLLFVHNIVMDIIDMLWIHTSSYNEDKVTYYILKGNLNKHLFLHNRNSDTIVAAEEAFTQATYIATAHLRPSHPERLRVAIEFSAYYYNIKDKPEKAFEIAKSAYDAAKEDTPVPKTTKKYLDQITKELEVFEDAIQQRKAAKKTKAVVKAAVNVGKTVVNDIIVDTLKAAFRDLVDSVDTLLSP